MDSERFDGLVRRFAQRASRRSVLKGLGGGVAVGALAMTGRHVAADGHKIEICHQPGTPAEQTLSVASASLGGHLGHGDYIGECCPAETTACVNADGYGSCCGNDQVCTDGACVTPSSCPVINLEAPACFWQNCFAYNGECCWDLNGYYAGSQEECQALDGCSDGGGDGSGGGCYQWATSSQGAPIAPPW